MGFMEENEFRGDARARFQARKTVDGWEGVHCAYVHTKKADVHIYYSRMDREVAFSRFPHTTFNLRVS